MSNVILVCFLLTTKITPLLFAQKHFLDLSEVKLKAIILFLHVYPCLVLVFTCALISLLNWLRLLKLATGIMVLVFRFFGFCKCVSTLCNCEEVSI